MSKILIADDREENRFVLINFFKLLDPESNKIEIIQADNSIDAISKAEEHMPSLILMDIKMETNDAGLVATQKLKSSPKTKSIPIWAITAQTMESYGQNGDKKKFLQLGCDDYITKPFDPIDLLIKAATLLKLQIPDEIKKRMGIK